MTSRSSLRDALPVAPAHGTVAMIKIVPGLPRYWPYPNTEPLPIWLVHVALDGRSRMSARSVLASLDRVAADEGYPNGATILRHALGHARSPFAVEYRDAARPIIYWRGARVAGRLAA